MENSNVMCSLLQTDELKLPTNIGKRCDRATVLVNLLLCLITCTAAIGSIIYCSWTLGEIERAKLDVNQQLDKIHLLMNANLGTDPEETESDEWDSISKDTGVKAEILIGPDNAVNVSDINNHIDVNVTSPKKLANIQRMPTKNDNFDNNDIDDDIDDGNGDFDNDYYDSGDYGSDYDIAYDSEDYAYDDEDEFVDYYSGDGSDDVENEALSRARRSSKVDKKTPKGERNEKSSKQKTKKNCKGKNCRKGKKNRKLSLPTAQYEATVSDTFISMRLAQFNKFHDTNGCSYITELQGNLCRSKIFTPEDYRTPLRIFHPAPWTDEKKSPLKFTNGAPSFQVKSDGILLVFAQVSFSTSRPINGARIVQRREPQVEQPIDELQCKQGIPQIAVNDTKVSQSCSIVGLLRVIKGDSLEIYSNYKKSGLDLSNGSTYFGAVQLSKG